MNAQEERLVVEAFEALAKECSKTAKEKGWWDQHRSIAEILCLWHSEISEALEETRDPNQLLGDIIWSEDTPLKPEGFLVEVADILIRIFDFVGYYHLEGTLARAIIEKTIYNTTRPYRHGGRTS